MLTVRLWVREDGEQPKAIPGDGTLPPGPGILVDVQARNAREARQILERAEAEDVSEETDETGWQQQRAARRRVRRVARVVLEERDGKKALVRGDLPPATERLVLIRRPKAPCTHPISATYATGLETCPDCGHLYVPSIVVSLDDAGGDA